MLWPSRKVGGLLIFRAVYARVFLMYICFYFAIDYFQE
jgi:hypothetical protein